MSGSNIIDIAGNVTGVGTGLNLGLVRGMITLADGTKVLNLAALARALESDQKNNVLSTPNILTLDNEEAKIVVGQNVPFVTGSYTQTSNSSSNPFQTIERKDVGLTLRVTPQVAEGGTVKLGRPFRPRRRVDSHAFARAHGVLPLAEAQGVVVVLTRPDATVDGLAEIRRVLQRPVQTEAVDAARFAAELARAYNTGDADDGELSGDLARETDLARLMQDLPEAEDLLEQGGGEAPVVRMINALLLQALRERASDLHFEPDQGALDRTFPGRRARLVDVLELLRALHAAIVSRLNHGRARHRRMLPAAGRAHRAKLGDKQVDVRMSTLPTGSGERVVLRLLDKDSARLDLATLGMSAPALAGVDRVLDSPHGIVLVTGPTGSGKTTTLYAALSRSTPRRPKILTVEDPIEYELPGVNPDPRQPEIELTFANVLRSSCARTPTSSWSARCATSPTAEIAIQASLTGHLVFSTVHTNDSATAMTRLIDMGVEPFLVASSLLAIPGPASGPGGLPRTARSRSGPPSPTGPSSGCGRNCLKRPPSS